MTPQSLTAALKEESRRLGFKAAGVCPAVSPPGIGHFHRWLADGFAGEMSYLADRVDAYSHPRQVLDGARSILMLAASYRTVGPAETAAGHGRVSRYAWGTDYHDVLRRRLRGLADFHCRLTPQAGVRGVVDTAPLLEREFAQLAGLGWIGKNTLLLNRDLGSWFFLAALLTTEELAYDQPFPSEHCGTCRACLDACPTGALVDAYRLDARKCISYLTIELRGSIPAPLRERQGEWLFGCDICQEVCPWNRRGPSSEEKGDSRHLCDDHAGMVPAFGPFRQMGTVPFFRPDFRPAPGMNPVELADLFLLDDEAFRQRFRHTPLWRPRRRGLLRNAAIVLGNRPAPTALPGLLRGLNDEEPSVRAACVWALGRLRDPATGIALQERLAVECDPEVRAELQIAIGTHAPQ